MDVVIWIGAALTIVGLVGIVFVEKANSLAFGPSEGLEYFFTIFFEGDFLVIFKGGVWGYFEGFVGVDCDLIGFFGLIEVGWEESFIHV